MRAWFGVVVLLTAGVSGAWAQGDVAKAGRPVAPASLARMTAGIPVNYDEDKVGTYTLPDPLVMSDGTRVKDAKTWFAKRRPEIVRLFETQQFGVVPIAAQGKPKAERFELVEKGSPALGGKAVRRRVDIHLVSKEEEAKAAVASAAQAAADAVSTANGSASGGGASVQVSAAGSAQSSEAASVPAPLAPAPVIHLVEYLPAGAKGAVPMLLSIGFTAPSNMVDDPELPVGEIWDPKTKTRISAKGGRAFGKIDVEPFLEAGIGVATFYYGDVDPDYADGFSQGIRHYYLKPGEAKRGAEEWGTIAAWAWGMSRVEDYFETDKDVDAKKVAIHGISRLGKTVMWAGAHDQRFAAVIASCSGEGGAALSHRDYGETIAHLAAPTRFEYQLAENYGKWGGFPDKAPMDAHMLIALIAPRPVLLQTGDTDFWSDPKGEFLAAVAAEPVYTLLGKKGLGLSVDEWPQAKVPVLHDIGYFMHEGGHGMVPWDWGIYLEFLKMHGFGK